MGRSGDPRKKSDEPQRGVAREQYTELNATLYESSPAAYLRFRLDALVEMHARSTAEGSGQRTYGALTIPPRQELTERERTHAVAMESTMLIHHAAETLARLYLAHLDKPSCPWLKLTQLTFPKVKAALAPIASPDYKFPVGDIECIFLGGASPSESALVASNTDWGGTVEGHAELMRVASDRLLEQAPLYNAAKHGLAGAPSERLNLTFGSGDDRVQVADGPAITYLSGYGTERNPWVANTDYVQLESDFATVELLALAIDNLWTVARRTYLAVPGDVFMIRPEHVRRAHLAGHVLRGNLATRTATPLHVKADPSAGWGEGLGPAKINLRVMRIGDETVSEVAESASTAGVIEVAELPLRNLDSSPFTGNAKYLFPFSPAWSSSV